MMSDFRGGEGGEVKNDSKNRTSFMNDPLGNFIQLQLIFGQKPCILGPRQLARWKVNILYGIGKFWSN